MNQCESTWMVPVSTLLFVWRPVWITGGTINQLSMQSKGLPMALKLLEGAKKHLKSQSINVSLAERILQVQYIAWRLVWTTGGPINQLSMQSKCLPLAIMLLQRAKVLLKIRIENMLLLIHNQLMWVNLNWFCVYNTLQEDSYGQQVDQ